MGRFNNNSGDGERGPGWYDVASEVRRLSSWHGDRIELLVTTGTSVNDRWGLYVSVRVQSTGEILGACGYGPSFPAGARTMASACFIALVKAWERSELHGRTRDDP